MAPDANGIIRHYHVDRFYWFDTLDPEWMGLPTTGTYRMRYILLAYGYQTYARQVTSNALGLTGDTRMSWQPISLSHMPSRMNYTPGMTDGIIPPFEYTYTRSPVLTSGIVFDAVFDMKNLTTFRLYQGRQSPRLCRRGDRPGFRVAVLGTSGAGGGEVSLRCGLNLRDDQLECLSLASPRYVLRLEWQLG